MKKLHILFSLFLISCGATDKNPLDTQNQTQQDATPEAISFDPLLPLISANTAPSEIGIQNATCAVTRFFDTLITDDPSKQDEITCSWEYTGQDFSNGYKREDLVRSIDEWSYSDPYHHSSSWSQTKNADCKNTPIDVFTNDSCQNIHVQVKLEFPNSQFITIIDQWIKSPYYGNCKN